MIEHISKWLELVPLPDYNNEVVASAFLDKVLNRFGVLLEIPIDQSTKFCVEFQKLCEETLIDHWPTS